MNEPVLQDPHRLAPQRVDSPASGRLIQLEELHQGPVEVGARVEAAHRGQAARDERLRKGLLTARGAFA